MPILALNIKRLAKNILLKNYNTRKSFFSVMKLDNRPLTMLFLFVQTF